MWSPRFGSVVCSREGDLRKAITLGEVGPSLKNGICVAGLLTNGPRALYTGLNVLSLNPDYTRGPIGSKIAFMSLYSVSG